MKIDQLTRREFLVVLAGVTSLVHVPLGNAAEIQPVCQMGRRLVRMFGNVLPSARIIGYSYLQRIPKERASDFLVEAIMHGDGCRIHQAWFLQDAELFECLKRKISLDFESDRIIVVDGWVLSVTEARLCALSTLMS